MTITKSALNRPGVRQSACHTGRLRVDVISSISQMDQRAETRASRETITDRVYASIRRDLLECRWPAGQRLKIRDIAAELGVSPMPVRIALKRLGEEGTLTVEENKSARVPFVSRKRFNEFLEISITLEELALDRAATRIEKAKLEELRRKADLMQRDIDAGRTIGYARRFNSLLMEIYQAGQSSALIEMIEYAWIHTAPPAKPGFEERGIVTRLHTSLIAILDALARNDARTARKTLASALQYATRNINLLLDIDEDPKLKIKALKRRNNSDDEST
jgi:DNA-binding GntR family transcriptional regulator